MRKLNKPKILSTKYKEWEEELERSGNPHPVYNSSRNRFYKDIVANLLHIQDGLCAYTEIRLCDEDIVDNHNWENGKFAVNNFEFKGQLDHFDPSLKTEKAWLWSNFYVVDSDVNMKKKRDSEVDSILDPGSVDYDEHRYLDYSCSTHLFIANSNLTPDEKERVNSMISVLGLNYGPIKDIRRRFLSEKFKSIDFGLEDSDTVVIDEFPTAFRICAEKQVRILN